MKLPSRLNQAMANKDWKQRQGALLIYECIIKALGRSFEPFVLQLLPELLKSFGDDIGEVRDACTACSRALMSTMTAYCVKCILPIVLDGLHDPKWRVKVGSVEFLGMWGGVGWKLILRGNVVLCALVSTFDAAVGHSEAHCHASRLPSTCQE